MGGKGRIHVFFNVRSWRECANFCPRLGKDSQLPSLDREDVLERFKEVGANDAYIPAPFTDHEKEGEFYDGTFLNFTFFSHGQPNGGINENCVFWSYSMMALCLTKHVTTMTA